MRGCPPQTEPLQMNCNRRVATVRAGPTCLDRWVEGSGHRPVAAGRFLENRYATHLQLACNSQALGRLLAGGARISDFMLQLCCNKSAERLPPNQVC